MIGQVPNLGCYHYQFVVSLTAFLNKNSIRTKFLKCQKLPIFEYPIHTPYPFLLRVFASNYYRYIVTGIILQNHTHHYIVFNITTVYIKDSPNLRTITH